MITHDQIGSDEDLAREILVVARDIAPCLASLPADSEDGKNAIAILRRVFTNAAARGSTLIRAQRVGPASVDYFDVRSVFDGQPARALRALCASGGGAAPRGSFPKERPLAKLWPETYQ